MVSVSGICRGMQLCCRDGVKVITRDIGIGVGCLSNIFRSFIRTFKMFIFDKINGTIIINSIVAIFILAIIGLIKVVLGDQEKGSSGKRLESAKSPTFQLEPFS